MNRALLTEHHVMGGAIFCFSELLKKNKEVKGVLRVAFKKGPIFLSDHECMFLRVKAHSQFNKRKYVFNSWLYRGREVGWHHSHNGEYVLRSHLRVTISV